MDDRLLQFYSESLKAYGPDSPKALAWRGNQSQLERFEILSQVGDLTGKSVLDEGCGLGDLYPFLASRYSDIRYTGIDINPEYITAAQKKYPGLDFQVADFSDYEDGPFDYVLASGTLTFKIPNYKEVYFGHIRKMFEMSRIGVAFNMLNKEHFSESDILATYSSAEIANFCATLTDKIALRNDYSLEDFTFYLYK